MKLNRFVASVLGLAMLLSVANADAATKTLKNRRIKWLPAIDWFGLVSQPFEILAPTWHAFAARGDFIANGVKRRMSTVDIVTVGTDFFGGSVDLKIYPFHYNRPGARGFQPYVIIGMGGFYRNPSSETVRQYSMPRLGGNLAWGIDFNITRNFSLSMEQSFRPLVNSKFSQCHECYESNYDSSHLLFTTMGVASFKF